VATTPRPLPALVGALLALLRLAAPVEASPRFREVAGAWGLGFVHRHGGTGDFYMIETMGSGLAILDFDGDGDEDVFFVDSGGVPGPDYEPPRPRLLRNEGGHRFVPWETGLALDVYGMGVTAADVEGDGDPDLYVTAFGGNRLFLNDGAGRFREATAAAGLEAATWSSSAAFADADRDGDLDLYVANYVDFAYDDNPVCGDPALGLRSYCHPDVYDGLPDRYFENLGGGRFADATDRAGFGGLAGKGLGVVWNDLDDDGWPDLYVANDMTANFLFRNRGDGTFQEIGVAAGVAYGERGEPEAGMGVDVGDLDGRGGPEVVVTNLDRQTNAVYSFLLPGLATDLRYPSGLAEPSLYDVGFGVALADFDLDADLDVVVANGHIIHNVDLWGRGTTYEQRNQVFENLGEGRFVELEASGLDVVRASRGLATGDLDGDGDLEVLVANSNGLAEAYENVGAEGGWLAVDLAGRGVNTAAIGARLEIAAGVRRQWREVRTASSYLSQNALTAHFGLGPAAVADLEVRWPSGRRQRLLGPPASRRLRVVEPGPGAGP
jgi:hypothetical protein